MVQNASSSGGVFTLLAQEILLRNGVVFGAMFDDEFKVVHGFVENSKDLFKLRGSKYVQSNMKNCFNIAQNKLNEGKLVLFTGTPCQIAGLKNFLRKDYENLITQDFICHGVPSPLVWEKYKTQQAIKHNSKLIKASFRDKPSTWLKYHLTMEFENGQIFSEAHSKNDYFKVFLSDKCLRDSCYECAFKGIQRESDITLADFWGANIIYPDKYDKMGTSLIVVNSLKGQKLFDLIKQKMDYKQIGLKLPTLFNPSMTHSSHKPNKRNLFMQKIKTLSFDEAYRDAK